MSAATGLSATGSGCAKLRPPLLQQPRQQQIPTCNLALQRQHTLALPLPLQLSLLNSNSDAVTSTTSLINLHNLQNLRSLRLRHLCQCFNSDTFDTSLNIIYPTSDSTQHHRQRCATTIQLQHFLFCSGHVCDIHGSIANGEKTFSPDDTRPSPEQSSTSAMSAAKMQRWRRTGTSAPASVLRMRCWQQQLSQHHDEASAAATSATATTEKCRPSPIQLQQQRQ